MGVELPAEARDRVPTSLLDMSAGPRDAPTGIIPLETNIREVGASPIQQIQSHPGSGKMKAHP